MATGSGNGNRYGVDSSQNYDNLDNGNGRDDFQNLSNDDKQTVDLVNQFKNELQARLKKNKSITEQDVEFATLDARRILYKDEYDPKKWKDDSLLDFDQSSGDLFLSAMAYAKTPKQIESIFQAKQQHLNKSTSTHSKRDPICTSLTNIIEPLQQLKEMIQYNKSQNLFAAVLEINDDQIDRADRMFYSEARRFIGDRNDYTFDHAHDQVQAIRLMHYETDDEKKLLRFIQDCRTFETAYSYLQHFARDRVAGRSPSASISKKPAPSNNTNALKSIIEPVVNDKQHAAASHFIPNSSYSSLHNSAANPPPLDRRSLTNSRSDDESIDTHPPGPDKRSLPPRRK